MVRVSRLFVLSLMSMEGSAARRSRIDWDWLGDADDWSRVSRVMHECGRDARRMEVWKGWLRPEEGNVVDEEKHVDLDRGRPEIALISAVVKNHVCGVLPQCKCIY